MTASSAPRSLIIVAGGVVILSLVFSLLFAGLGGSGYQTCGSPASIRRCGTTTVTIASGQASGASTITFSPAFNVAPFVSVLQRQTTGQVETISTSVTFLAVESAGQGWTPSMPAAQTELFGDSTHRVSLGNFGSLLPLSGSTSATLSVDCSVSSIGNTPVLRPMYSSDSGATWNELAQTTGSLDVSITFPNCAAGGSLLFASGLIVSGARSAVNLQLRIDGIGGADIGDVPVFSLISLVFANVLTFQPFCIIQARSTASATIRCATPFAVTSSTAVTVDWTAQT